MNLALDIGNTHIKAGLFNKDRLEEVTTLLPRELSSLSSHAEIHQVIVSNVGRKVDLQDLLPGFPQDSIYHLAATSRLPFVIDYATPQTLGADRLASAAGAITLFPGTPLLVIDAGTCITIDFIDTQAVYHGGAILPGFHLKLEALHHFTAQLPQVPFDSHTAASLPSLTGKTTEESILAGVVSATVLEVESFVRHYATRYPDLHVVLTGGDSPYLHRTASYLHTHDESLLLKGLNAILLMNTSQV
jgi:type III pantothenate kinase